MKSKSMILIAVSLGFGLVAAIGISQVMGRNSNQAAAPKEETKPVMVSLDYMDTRAEISEGLVTIEQWPASMVPPNAVTSLDEVKDKVLNCRVAKKMPILQEMLVNRNDVAPLAIPPGYKVVGIKLPADDLLAGLLNPGDTVDLIGVFNSDKTKISRTFLTKIRVFSVNNKTTPELERGKERGGQGGIVGVLVTKTQAEKLILAQKVAQIKLILRSEDGDAGTFPLASSESDSNDGTTTDDFSGEQPPSETPKPDGFDAVLGKLLAGNKESNVVHNMVMVTPDGPVSFVFHKDTPLPQRIDGYTVPVTKSFAAPDRMAPAPGQDVAPALNDPADSTANPDHAGDSESVDGGVSDDESGRAANEQEDQF